MDEEKRKIYQDIAHTIRFVSIDAVQKANSGHPGLPMGCAEIGAYLWGEHLRYNSLNPDWFDRDRFVLSAGHGSMFLYSLLHLTGYDVTLEDLQSFRQLGSKTPGHPECRDTDGVEVTTGPLGQGVANAVGFALAQKMLAARLNKDGDDIVTGKVFCLAGDGCLMEGVSTEASSLAGHLCLNNLVLLYDMNKITLDGEWKESCSDNQIERYKSMGWDVIEIKDANDLEQVEEAMKPLKTKQDRPTLVVCHTVIGKYSPKEGTNKVHGSPLGEEGVKASKEKVGWPQEPFYIPANVREFFEEKKEKGKQLEQEWNQKYDSWKAKHPDLHELFTRMKDHHIPETFKDRIMDIDIPEEKIAGRAVSERCIQVIAKELPFFIGGAADLSGSNNTTIASSPFVTADDFAAQNIKFGVREFAMSAMANAISMTILRPFVGTFFCFYDYARPAVRLAALSHQPVVFVYTHDSIGLGEDGPTHQPVEHLASARAVPNLDVWRPGDADEAKASWIAAAGRREGPTILVYTRQGLPCLEETKGRVNDILRGGYVLVAEDKSKPITHCIIGTGSELSLARDVADALRSKHGANPRVVSLPCWEEFERQEKAYKESILGGDLGQRICIEAGATLGWERYIGKDGIPITMDEFGTSAPIADAMQKYGFTVDQVIERVKSRGKEGHREAI